MKGPMECVQAEPDKGDDFAEFMWMAEENLDDFDKQCEQELLEEMMLNQALDDFEDQAEAALYAEQGLNPPRHMGYDAQGLAVGMNNLQMNGHGPRGRGRGGYRGRGRGGYNQYNRYPPPSQYQMPPPTLPPPEVVAASSSLNPNAPAFVFNPNAPVFVPSWSAPPAPGPAAAVANVPRHRIPPAPPATVSQATNGGGPMSYAAVLNSSNSQEPSRTNGTADEDAPTHHR